MNSLKVFFYIYKSLDTISSGSLGSMSLNTLQPILDFLELGLTLREVEKSLCRNKDQSVGFLESLGRTKRIWEGDIAFDEVNCLV